MREPDAIVRGEFGYRATIRPKGARTLRVQGFGELADFAVPGGDPDAMPVTLRVALGRDEAITEYRTGPGGLHGSVEDGRLQSGVAERWLTYVPDKGFPTGSVDRQFSPDPAAMAGTVHASDREERLAAAHAAAAAAFHIGGRVWSRCIQPALVVAPWSGDRKPDIRHEAIRDIHSQMMPFHVADLDAALDWAAAIRDNPIIGAPAIRIVPPPVPAWIGAEPDREAFAVDYGAHVLSRIARSSFGKDFSQLPVAALERWVAFRAAEARVAAGDGYAVTEAYEALVELRGMTSADVDPRTRNKPEDCLAELRFRLEEPVLHWTRYLGALAPRPPAPADLAALDAIGGP